MQAKQKLEKYGLKTLHSLKEVKEPSVFEELIAVVKDINLEKREVIFTTLQEDIKLIHNSKKTMTFADKTSNMYQLIKEEHNKLLRNAITLKSKKKNKKNQR